MGIYISYIFLHGTCSFLEIRQGVEGGTWASAISFLELSFGPGYLPLS